MLCVVVEVIMTKLYMWQIHTNHNINNTEHSDFWCYSPECTLHVIILSNF